MTLPPVPQRTTPGFSFSLVERSLLECIADRDFGKDKIALVVSAFGPECAYCGGPVERWDHLVAISQGGDTVLGNMVPACSACDDSKRHLAFDAWVVSTAPGSPVSRGVVDLDARLAKIHAYAARHAYEPRAPESRLTSDELEEFERIRNTLTDIRAEVDAFIARHRARVAKDAGRDS